MDITERLYKSGEIIGIPLGPHDYRQIGTVLFYEREGKSKITQQFVEILENILAKKTIYTIPVINTTRCDEN